MMNNFFRSKITSNMFFHHKPMFKNIISFSPKRVVGLLNKNISSAAFTFSPFPIRMVFSFWSKFWVKFIKWDISFFELTAIRKIFSSLPLASHGTIFSKTMTYKIKASLKFFMTMFTNSCNHFSHIRIVYRNTIIVSSILIGWPPKTT